MPENELYVPKRNYDALLNAFNRSKLENAALRDILEELRRKTQTFDDRVLEDIHQFTHAGVHQLDEEKAYLIGAFNAMTAFRYDIEELEGKHHV